MKLSVALLLGLAALAAAKVHFVEKFDEGWKDRWVASDWKKSEGQAGEWAHTTGPFYGDAEEDKGIQTSQDARFYAISSKISESFSNNGKDLVFQFQVRFPQKIDCGGGYIKLLPESLDQKKFSGDSEYAIMFGPDICGTSTKKTHLIFNYKGKNLLVKREIRTESDQLSHVYTMILHPDNTYEVRIDGEKAQSGNLLEDWDFLPPKKIRDPTKSKPADWVDEATIDDPTDTKPASWDDIPKMITDPEAERPDDWDDEADGKWEPPMIDNHEFKGEWKAKKIPNPAYKGPWVHPEIDNPDHVEDKQVYSFPSLAYVGIELWQVKSGTLFDNIIVTDNIAEAEELMAATFTKNKAAEKAMFDKAEEDKRKAEEAERAKNEKKDEDKDEDSDSKKAHDDDDDDDDDKPAHDEL